MMSESFDAFGYSGYKWVGGAGTSDVPVRGSGYLERGNKQLVKRKVTHASRLIEIVKDFYGANDRHFELIVIVHDGLLRTVRKDFIRNAPFIQQLICTLFPLHVAVYIFRTYVELHNNLLIYGKKHD